MNKIEKFQKANPTKADKEKALKSMSNREIDELIAEAGTKQAKIFYSQFLKPVKA
jgi:riboflavin biosynthesis pyrimidine reductase